MDGAFYVDVGGSYNILKRDDGAQVQIFAKVDNLFNVDPAPNPQFGSLPISNGTNPVLYDTLGRLYRIGFRVKN